ncbi:hypothetical protein MRX96_054541 [Rhipicephalus microplus]
MSHVTPAVREDTGLKKNKDDVQPPSLRGFMPLLVPLRRNDSAADAFSSAMGGPGDWPANRATKSCVGLQARKVPVSAMAPDDGRRRRRRGTKA